MTIDVDVWVRGTLNAKTCQIHAVPDDASGWTDEDVRRLLSEMLLALERERNPGGEAPAVTLRGFSWIVSPYESGVLVHLEMQIGTVSAGPLATTEERLTPIIARLMATETPQVVH